MPYLQSGAVRLHYADHGAGEPVLFLHGLTSSFSENWVETGWSERFLGEGFRVVLADVRGHGRSDKPDSPEAYETELLAGDALALLDRLSIERAHVVGFSMGAGIGLRLAMDRPDRAGAVVVAGIGDKAIRGLHDAAEIREIARALETVDGDAVPPGIARTVRRKAERPGNDRRALAAFFRRGGWPADLLAVAKAEAPVLVVVAGEDEFMGGGERLSALIGAARRVTIDGSRHAAVVRDPRFLEVALSFVREHSLSGT